MARLLKWQKFWDELVLFLPVIIGQIRPYGVLVLNFFVQLLALPLEIYVIFEIALRDCAMDRRLILILTKTYYVRIIDVEPDALDVLNQLLVR